MSDTELPLVNTFLSDAHGLSAWRPVFDRLSIDKLPDGRRHLRLIIGDQLVHQRMLTKAEAAHLATLLVG